MPEGDPQPHGGRFIQKTRRLPIGSLASAVADSPRYLLEPGAVALPPGGIA